MIAGDLNNSQTNLKKIYNIYHLKSTGTQIKKIDINHKISEYPIIIFRKALNVALLNEKQFRTILDNNIIKRNNEILKIILNNKTQTPIFINPNKTIE